MKKRIVSVFLVAAILSALVATAAAAQARAANYTPVLSFDGTTANCYFSVTALGKPITATLELWHGSTRVAKWSDSATSRLIIDEDCTVTKGQTYTLKVSGTIDGASFTGIPVTGTA